MGFFSFNTSDTNESIPVSASEREGFTFYMLQPNSAPPIRVDEYEGYGVMAGVDIYRWLAEQNFGDPTLISLAINADCGHYTVDSAGTPHLCAIHWDAAGVAKIFGDTPVVMFPNYASPIASLHGLSANDALESGVLEQRKIPLRYPFKFVRDPALRYEDVPPSTGCQFQGYFYPN